MSRVDSVVDLDPRIGRAQYPLLAAFSPAIRPPAIDTAFCRMVGPRTALLVDVVPPAQRRGARIGPHDARVASAARRAPAGDRPRGVDLDFIDVLARSGPMVVASSSS